MLERLFKKKPQIIKLYKWNKTKTEARCSVKDFNRVFAGYNVVHDLETNKTFAIFTIGHNAITVVRDDKNV